MDARFGRWWRRRSTKDHAVSEEAASGDATSVPLGLDPSSVFPVPVVAGDPSIVVFAPATTPEAHSVSDATDEWPAPGLPEQPVLVPATSSSPARIGVVLPAGRASALLRHIPLPRVPKRTVFAVGICAGLAAPLVGRQLAVQALMALVGQGRATRPLEGATVEIIRIHYAGAAAGHAASAVAKILEQVRR